MGSMRSMCACTLGLLVGIGAGLAGCGSSPASPPATPATAATAEDEVAADLSEHHRHHHHGGITKFISMSLDSLGVSPEQSDAVKKIQTDLEAHMDRARAAEQSVVVALADGITAGHIDQANVDGALAKVAGAAAELHDATADSLNQLHAILTPAERAALVNKVEAHWDVWKKANAVGDVDADSTSRLSTTPPSAGPSVSPEGVRNDAGPASGGHLGILARELNLTPEQVDRIRSNLATEVNPPLSRLDPREVEASLQAFGSAFMSDTFDAKALRQVSNANAQLAGWGAARMARFYEAVTPALTPDQRTSLAAMLREHANHPNAG